MGIERGIFDTGPLLHLREVDLSNILKACTVIVTSLVEEELKKMQVTVYDKRVMRLSGKDKDRVEFLSRKHEIQLPDASCILAAKKTEDVLFTDDYGVRVSCVSENVEVYGTIGILLRQFRDGVLTKTECVKGLKALRESSLFITERLILDAIKEVKSFDK